MLAKIIRRFDNKGRIVIPPSMLRLLEINKNTEVIICRSSKGKVVIRKIDDLKDWEIVAISHIDGQGRLIIPSEIRECTTEVEIYFKDGSLILKEAQ